MPDRYDILTSAGLLIALITVYWIGDIKLLGFVIGLALFVTGLFLAWVKSGKE